MLNTAFVAVPTALTRQDDKNYYGHTSLPQDSFTKNLSFFLKQNIRAVKIGMLANTKTTRGVVRIIKALKKNCPDLVVVWDPVLKSTSGGVLMSSNTLSFATKKLLPLATLIMPNAQEACRLLRKKFTRKLKAQDLAQALVKKLKTNVYVKGGHLERRNEDFLAFGEKIVKLTAQRWSQKYRGTGCTLSTAIACYLLQNFNLFQACQKAKGNLKKLVSL